MIWNDEIEKSAAMDQPDHYAPLRKKYHQELQAEIAAKNKAENG